MVQPVEVFDELEFIYLPSVDVAAELARYVEGLGADVVFAIEAFDTRVAMLRLTAEGPKLLLAQHLHGEQPVLIYRVPDLAAAEADLARRGSRMRPALRVPRRRRHRARRPRAATHRGLRAHAT